MKVLFVRPNEVGAQSIPIGITVLQACLKKAGHDVLVFDTTFLSSNFQEITERYQAMGFFKPVDISSYIRSKDCDVGEELMSVIDDFHPDIVAFSLMSNDFLYSKRLAELIKKKYPDLLTIFGGIHPTVDPEDTINLDCVDMLCVGEGEEALVELVDRIEKGQDITAVKNVWMKKNGKIIRNEVRPFVDLDNIPVPDCTGFSQKHLYRPFWGKVYRIMDVEMSRGCHFNCFECINFYLRKLYKKDCRYHREKSFPKAIADLKFIKENYKPDILRFMDEIMMPWNVSKMREFAEFYKKEIGLPFIAFGKVGYLNEEKVDILKDMGCISLSFGLESGNDHLRKKILNRHMTNKQIVETFQLCNRKRLRTTAFNLLGLPEEGRKEIFDTIEANRQSDPGVTCAGFVYPFAGTVLREYCLKKGYIDEDVPMVNYDVDTVIRNDRISKQEQYGLLKTFILYVSVPKWMYPIVRFCELPNQVSYWLYCKLVKYFRDKNFRKNDERYDPIPEIADSAPVLNDFDVSEVVIKNH
ncbi:MAG: cobalamin-dependent protein [Candidatus Omnitrophica bacterium]|nr:cobalamin-dependent protein [Candidatus Omnitrophota bacterium]